MVGRAEEVPWDVLAMAATRPPMLRLFAVPYWAVVPIMGIPFLALFMTANPWCLLLIPAVAAGIRALFVGDYNRPRVWLLGLLSGNLLGGRRTWGGVSHDPLGVCRRARD